MRSLLVLAGLTLVLSSCTRTRTVVIERPAPPPTIVTVTDTVVTQSPPVTVYRDSVRIVEGERVVVERTVPIRVIEYRDREGRPVERTDSSFAMHAVSIDTLGVVVFGTDRDYAYKTPVPGETLVIRAEGGDSLSSVVLGQPVAPPPIVVTCPEPPRCIVPGGFYGKIQATFWIVGLLVIGAVIGFVLSRFSVLR